MRMSPSQALYHYTGRTLMVQERDVDMENDGLVIQSVFCDMGLSLCEATQLANNGGLDFSRRHP